MKKENEKAVFARKQKNTYQNKSVCGVFGKIVRLINPTVCCLDV